MYKYLLNFILLCCYTFPVFSLSKTDNIGSFYIQEQLIQNNLSFNLLSKGKKIGTLRPVLNTGGSFEYLDENDEIQVLLKFTQAVDYNLSNTYGFPIRKFGLRSKEYKFNVYDKNNLLIAKLHMFSDVGLISFLRFSLLSPDDSTILMQGGSILLSMETIHKFYTAEYSRLIVKLSRSLWTLQRNSHVTIIDKTAFYKYDVNMFAAVLALYCMHDIDFLVDP